VLKKGLNRISCCRLIRFDPFLLDMPRGIRALFEKVVLRRSVDGQTPTIGDVAEAMLFYKEVHLIIDTSFLTILVANLGRHNVLSLLSRDNVSATYVEEQLGIHTVSSPPSTKIHDFVTFQFAGSKAEGKLKSRDDRMVSRLIKSGLSKGQAVGFAEGFKRHSTYRTLSGDHFISGGIPNAARDDLDDTSYISSAVRSAVLDKFGPTALPPDFNFDIRRNKKGFSIKTNLNFLELNRDSDAELNEAHIISSVLNARADALMSAYFGGDFRTSQLVSEVLKAKYSHLVGCSDESQQELASFQSVLVKNAVQLREIIDGGERTFSEFLLLLDKAEKFRDWIHSASSEGRLVTEYANELRSVGFLRKTPTKVIRYLLTTSVGFVHPPTGLALSTADSFLLDRLKLGWRPNHFVGAHFAPFVGDN